MYMCNKYDEYATYAQTDCEPNPIWASAMGAAPLPSLEAQHSLCNLHLQISRQRLG